MLALWYLVAANLVSAAVLLSLAFTAPLIEGID
jgi:hypothetical protein